MNQYRKKIDKIYKKINKLALKGRDNELEYFNYINDLISKGDYSYLEVALFTNYYIDISKAPDVSSFKEWSWNEICQQTKSNFSISLYNLYKRNSVYQLSFNIYTDDNILLGQIVEKEVTSADYEFYVKNQEYARLVGELKTYLEVKKETELAPIIIDVEDLSLSEERNLLTRYELAIEYLLS